jgi:sugar phosphate isomerase/epimerase
MKLSLTPISFARTIKAGEMDLQKLIDHCAELQLDAIDLLDTRGYGWLWRDFAAQSRTLPARLEAAGLKLAAYGCGNNFAQIDDEAFEKQVETVVNAVTEAAAVGAPALRIFGGYHQESGGQSGVTTSRGFERVMQGVERCLPAAERAGVVLALENHGRLPGHSHEILALLNHFDSPWLKSLFDCGNFMANNMDEPEDPLSAYQRLRGRIAHVHVKDFGPAVARRQARIEAYPAGDGNVPLRQLAALMEEDGYEGYCSLEFEAGFKISEIEGVGRSFAYLREVRQTLRVLGRSRSKGA